MSSISMVTLDGVTVEPIEVIKHHGQTILRGRYDGEFDRTNLPRRRDPD